MGERKGQNKYYPPDFDPAKHGNLNRYHGVHALRERAAKIREGILIIRFEMPFNIWCEGCCRHVAMGVRYNAEKKKVGNYYSTPIFEFRMRCHLCENYFVIRTDPANFDYALISGCKRQEKRWQPGDYDGVEHTKREISQKIASDPMFKLEHGEKDKAATAADEPRMEALEAHQERLRDDFLANSILRRDFRARKKELAADGIVDAELLARSSLPSLPLQAEKPEDRRTAALLSRPGPSQLDAEEKLSRARQAVQDRPLFQPSSSAPLSPTAPPASGMGLAKSAKRIKTKNLEVAEAFRSSLKAQVRRQALAKSPPAFASSIRRGSLQLGKRPASPSSLPSSSLLLNEPPLVGEARKTKEEEESPTAAKLSKLVAYADSDESTSPSSSPITDHIVED